MVSQPCDGENGIRLISVTGDVSEDNPEQAEQVFEALKKEILPEIATVNQVEWRMSGLAEQEQDFLNDARVGMILTLLGIYLVLTWIFASWTTTFCYYVNNPVWPCRYYLWSLHMGCSYVYVHDCGANWNDWNHN